MTNPSPGDRASFEMRFHSLFAPGRSLAFPCDAQGHVNLDGLPGRARNNYLFARTLIGREYSVPRLCRCDAPAIA
jgi:hypothetical protein